MDVNEKRGGRFVICIVGQIRGSSESREGAPLFAIPTSEARFINITFDGGVDQGNDEWKLPFIFIWL